MMIFRRDFFFCSSATCVRDLMTGVCSHSRGSLGLTRRVQDGAFDADS